MNKVATFQIGKNGITATVLQTLARMLEDHKFIRIAALPASGRDRSSIKTMADALVTQLIPLGVTCSYTVIGFTIILRKHVNLQPKKK
jgi:RNA-binding protein YhbY